MSAEPPVVLLTRPEAESQRFARALREGGCPPFTPLVCPLMQIDLHGPLPDLQDVAGLVLTSIQTVRAYARLDGPRGLRAWCVGPGTAQAAQKAGLIAEAPGRDAESLVAALLARKVPGPLMHLRGTHTRGAVAARLTAAGIETREAVIYDQRAIAPDEAGQAALAGHWPLVAPLFSPRSAQLLAARSPKAPLLVAAMSEAVANAVASLHIMALSVAARPDSPAMVSATIDLVRQAGEKAYDGGGH